MVISIKLKFNVQTSFVCMSLNIVELEVMNEIEIIRVVISATSMLHSFQNFRFITYRLSTLHNNTVQQSISLEWKQLVLEQMDIEFTGNEPIIIDKSQTNYILRSNWFWPPSMLH